MGNFYWEGTDKQGSLHEGALESHSRDAAKEHLLQEGYYRVRFWKIQQSHLHRSLNNTEITEFSSTLIEPLLMILIALGVLGFLLSMYLPLFRMAERF